MRAARLSRRISTKNDVSRDVMAAYRAAVGRYAKEPWVSGVAIGLRQRKSEIVYDGELVIAIHVRKKLKPRGRVPSSRLIPKRILGIPTDVVEADYQRAGGGGAAVIAAPGAPLQPGHSIGRADVPNDAATIGGVVLAADNTPLLLCAGHTLKKDGNKGKKGDPIVHPGTLDSTAPTVVARFRGTHIGMDAGIARLEPGVQAINDALVSGVTIGPPATPMIADILEKVGRSTGRTQAVVLSLGLVDNVFPAVHLVPISGDVDTTPLADFGDSGALWYDTLTGEGKALHTSGSGVAPAGHEYGGAAMLPDVLKALKVRWAQGLVNG